MRSCGKMKNLRERCQGITPVDGPRRWEAARTTPLIFLGSIHAGLAHRVVKLWGSKSDNQTESSNYTLKEYMALLHWQLASGGNESGELVIAKGNHWRKNHSRAMPRMVWCLRRLST
jgi:hypothetical protein